MMNLHAARRGLRARLLLCICLAVSGARCGATPEPLVTLHPGGVVPSLEVPLYQLAIDPGTAVHPGRQGGYGLTAALGSTFRLMWTVGPGADRPRRLFYGSIYTVGQFLQVDPGCRHAACPLGAMDAVSAPVTTAGGQRIDFTALGTANLAGLDFMVDEEPAFLEVYVDDQANPGLVFVQDALTDGKISRVEAIPFGVFSR